MTTPAHSPTTSEMHTVLLERKVVAGCSEVGDPHTVVILHGWQKNLEVLRPLGELLVSTKTRVLLVDLPGFGRSPLPHGASNGGGGWDTAQYADAVRQMLLEKGITHCTLIGHSFGGRISVRLASKYPDLVRGIVLIASHGIPRERTPMESFRIGWIRTLTRLAKSIDGVLGTSLFARHLAPRFGSADYKAAGELRKTMVKTVTENLTYEAGCILTPALLLWGEDDRETPPDIGRKFKVLIKNSSLHIFPNKGHEPYADVGSHLLATYIQLFLAESTMADSGENYAG